jgi:hypothetical protein
MSNPSRATDTPIAAEIAGLNSPRGSIALIPVLAMSYGCSTVTTPGVAKDEVTGWVLL